MNQELESKFSKIQNNDLDLGIQQINIFDFFEKDNREDEQIMDE